MAKNADFFMATDMLQPSGVLLLTSGNRKFIFVLVDRDGSSTSGGRARRAERTRRTQRAKAGLASIALCSPDRDDLSCTARHGVGGHIDDEGDVLLDKPII
jgi:hypothetical protein